MRHDSSYVFDPADIDSTGRLGRPSHSAYSRDAAGETNAQVRIVERDRVFEYAADPARPGRYPVLLADADVLIDYRESEFEILDW